MRWGWLLPDASYQVLYDGWERQPYRPRHGKPPFVIRGAYSAAMAFSRARERYLGAADEDYATAAGVQAAAGPRTASSVRAVASPGARAGARTAAGVSTASVGAPSGRRPRSADLLVAGLLPRQAGQNLARTGAGVYEPRV